MAESQQPPSQSDHNPSGANPSDANPSAEDTRSPEGGTQHGPLMRGRGLAAAAAVAVGLIAAVVIVSVTRDGSDASDGSDTVDIAADATTTPDATTTADAGAPVSTDGPFEVLLEPGSDGLLQLTVADPATPAATDATSQHCVLVTLSGPATVEAFGCMEAGAADAGEVVLSTPGDPLVGCAAVATRGPDGEITAIEATSEFVVNESADLPAGEYDVAVVAVTGVGDGCPPIDDGGAERETTARGSILID